MTGFVACEECGASYRLSDRRTRDVRAGRTRPLCPACRVGDVVGPPAAEHFAWVERLPAHEREWLLDLVSAIRL